MIMDVTISSFKAIDIGSAIHKRVVAEGGYMVHESDRSWFEHYDRSSGEFSRRFSDELMRDIVRCRSSLRIYAAWRRASLEQSPLAPPGARFFADPNQGKIGTPANELGTTATQNTGGVMHVLATGTPAVVGVDLAPNAAQIAVVAVEKQAGGGFCARIAPHGARRDGREEGE